MLNFLVDSVLISQQVSRESVEEVPLLLPSNMETKNGKYCFFSFGTSSKAGPSENVQMIVVGDI